MKRAIGGLLCALILGALGSWAFVATFIAWLLSGDSRYDAARSI